MDKVISTSSERLRTTWTPSMDRFFIDLVLEQVRRGNMIDHAFRKQVWTHMTILFNEKFGYQYDKEILKNRYKSLRRKYNEITTLLNQRGFDWDGARQMVIADDNVWDDYIKAHPDKRSYRTKILPYYSDLCMIYGKTPAYEKYSCSDHNDDLDDDSSRTKSGEVSEGLQSPHTPVAHGDSVDDAQDSSDLGQDMAQRSVNEGMENALCGVGTTDPALAIKQSESDNLIPVEVIFSLEASPNILNIGSSNRSRVSWTPSMDHYFIDLMLCHVNKGNKIGHSFNKEAWIHMTSLFGEKFGSQYDKDVLHNRFKTLRRQYISIKSLLSHRGFHWDETLQMVTADVHVWEDYIKANPDARQYRVRPVPYFNDLCVIHGDSKTHVPCRETSNDAQEESSHLGGDTDISSHLNKRLFATPSASEHSKKSRRSTDEGIMDVLREMATAVTSLADKKKQNNNSTSIENVIDALQALPDIDEDLLLDACDFLEDDKKAKTFLALDVKLRKKWLMRKLHPSQS